jgi:hypothetical protein
MSDSWYCKAIVRIGRLLCDYESVRSVENSVVLSILGSWQEAAVTTRHHTDIRQQSAVSGKDLVMFTTKYCIHCYFMVLEQY